ncbi:MAG: deoxyribonuclease IV [Candidatus Taylorbacteria bacterium]|nr:deoxyribonuclease IV [Candidatus Taylorbacteria bacterium]
MLRIGAHQSIAGGYAKAVERVHAIGGNCLQIFSASPRSWSRPAPDAEDKKNFLKLREEFDVHPVYFHASYLINLADGGEVGRRSVGALIAELKAAGDCDIVGSIIHLGSFKNADSAAVAENRYSILIANIKEILDNTPKRTFFIIENSATRKIGRRLEEIANIINWLGSDRVRVCLDTCHLHAAGYDLSSRRRMEDFLKDFDSQIGLSQLQVWHANDSRDAFGSLRDRHENIGEGKVAKAIFSLLLQEAETKYLPFIIETPGFDGQGPDAENIARLRSLEVG